MNLLMKDRLMRCLLKAVLSLILAVRYFASLLTYKAGIINYPNAEYHLITRPIPADTSKPDSARLAYPTKQKPYQAMAQLDHLPWSG